MCSTTALTEFSWHGCISKLQSSADMCCTLTCCKLSFQISAEMYCSQELKCAAHRRWQSSADLFCIKTCATAAICWHSCMYHGVLTCAMKCWHVQPTHACTMMECWHVQPTHACTMECWHVQPTHACTMECWHVQPTHACSMCSPCIQHYWHGSARLRSMVQLTIYLL